VLEVAEQEQSRFFCLGSKYTARRGTLLNSVVSAYIYRYSLRRREPRANLSLILVPAIAEVGVLAAEHYWQRHGVGCFKLSNTADASNLVLRLLASGSGLATS